MAARLTRLGVLVTLTAGLILTVSACASVDRPTVQADQVPLPTPLRSFDASVADTLTALEAAVASTGERLETPVGAYRPSEPQDLLQTPRVVRRAALADADDGYVIVYEAGSRGAALEQAQALADYLESGFGQTNYVADSQFSVSTLEDTVIFATWSRRASGDAARAEAVFDAIATVGTPLTIDK